MDNLNTPDNMSKNTHTKLFKLWFSGASGNSSLWFRCAEKPSIYAPFGTWYFSGNRFCNTFATLFSKTCFRADEIVPLGLQLNLKIA